MPKTKRYRSQLQSAVFTANSQISLPAGQLWVAFYESDPTIDPDSNAPSPIAWAEGTLFHLLTWAVDDEGFASNQTGFILTNNNGRQITARYFVLWGSDAPSNSYFVEQVGWFGYVVADGGTMPIDPGDIVIEEF